MITISRRFRVLSSESGPRVVEINGSKYAESDLLACEDMRRFLKRLGLLRPAVRCRFWLNEFDLVLSDERPHGDDHLMVWTYRRGDHQTWSPDCNEGPNTAQDDHVLRCSYDLHTLIAMQPENVLCYLTVQPLARLLGGYACIRMSNMVECPPGELFEKAAVDYPLEPVGLDEIMDDDLILPSQANDLDADDLIALVPGLHAVEGFISGLQVDADCCWEGHAVMYVHRAEILRRIGLYVGPNADTWYAKTEEPCTRTQEAFDTMARHFLEECPENNPEMAVYLEARKSTDGLEEILHRHHAWLAKGRGAYRFGKEPLPGHHPLIRRNL